MVTTAACSLLFMELIMLQWFWKVSYVSFVEKHERLRPYVVVGNQVSMSDHCNTTYTFRLGFPCCWNRMWQYTCHWVSTAQKKLHPFVHTFIHDNVLLLHHLPDITVCCAHFCRTMAMAGRESRRRYRTAQVLEQLFAMPSDDESVNGMEDSDDDTIATVSCAEWVSE